LEITKTALSLMLVMITILTTLTTTIAAYAGGDDNNDDNGDGNKQRAEDDSAAAIADCDENEVEQARFLCIALATNGVEIETPEEEPPEEEEELLVVCKEVNDPNQEVVPFDIRFIVRSESPGTTQFQGGPPGDPGPSCSSPFGPGEVVGEYSVTEDTVGSLSPLPDSVEVEGDCVQDPTNPLRATGEIQEGETQTCTFIDTYEDDS
jgi:hypothetical protein